MLEYSIDRAAGIVTITGGEAASPAEAEALFQAILADPNVKPGDGILRDRRHLPAPGADVVRRSVDFLAKLPRIPTTRFAIVVAQGDKSSYGMMRMLQILASGVSVEAAIFFDLEEARRWLQESRSAVASE
jgi:hypothetical protein